MNNKYQLILGSKSPRRKELLGWLDVPFKVVTAAVEEVSFGKTPVKVVQEIAAIKGEAVLSKCLKEKKRDKKFFPLVVASDTIVCLENVIFGKPTSRENAKSILMRLSGKTHVVITAVWLGRIDLLTGKKETDVFHVKTEVTFRDITPDILNFYLDSNESMDKAGAYGVQGKAQTFISSLNGPYSNVVGFPLDEFIFRLKRFVGYEVDQEGRWRNLFTN